MELVEWIDLRLTSLDLVSYQSGVARRQSEAYSSTLSAKYALVSACPRFRYFGVLMCPNPWARPAGCIPFTALCRLAFAILFLHITAD